MNSFIRARVSLRRIEAYLQAESVTGLPGGPPIVPTSHPHLANTPTTVEHVYDSNSSHVILGTNPGRNPGLVLGPMSSASPSTGADRAGGSTSSSQSSNIDDVGGPNGVTNRHGFLTHRRDDATNGRCDDDDGDDDNNDDQEYKTTTKTKHNSYIASAVSATTAPAASDSSDGFDAIVLENVSCDWRNLRRITYNTIQRPS